jgi:hypothetical protein
LFFSLRSSFGIRVPASRNSSLANFPSGVIQQF